MSTWHVEFRVLEDETWTKEDGRLPTEWSTVETDGSGHPAQFYGQPADVIRQVEDIRRGPSSSWSVRRQGRTATVDVITQVMDDDFHSVVQYRISPWG